MTSIGICPTQHYQHYIGNKRRIIKVCKSQHGLAPRIFNAYFTKSQHSKNTRGIHSSLSLPNVRTEVGRKLILFQGSKLFNKLPDI